jgi:hypothetical protein
MIGVLYREELKAAMRGRFAWLGAGVVLLILGGIAAVATQDTWLDGYGIIAYFLVPLAFIPLSAGVIAGARASRFVESVFTAPIDRRDWLIARVLVLLTLAAAYYAALLPMLGVYASHVGLPFLLRRFLWWTPGLLVSSIAIGVLIGVLFIGRSIAAPAATGMGVLLLYAGLAPLQELLVAQGNGASRTGHLTLLSPAVLLKNALGFALATSSVPATSTRTWVCIGAMVILAVVVAAWVFLKAQGVETWEATPAQRWTIAAAIVALVVIPVTLGDANYDRPAPPANNAPAIRALFARSGSSLALVDPGGSLPSRCCSTILNRDEWPAISTDALTRRDLVVLLPVDSRRSLVDLRIDVAGEDGLIVTPDPDATPLQHLEKRLYADESGPAAADGHRVLIGWVARIPVTIDPARPWDTGGMRYPIDVTATYRLDGDAAPHVLKARAAIEAQIGSALWQMSAAAMIVPLLCLGIAFSRWRRTR